MLARLMAQALTQVRLGGVEVAPLERHAPETNTPRFIDALLP